MTRYRDCEALKSAASFSTCLPSSPDIACHQLISVTAHAGEARLIATVAAANCKHLSADFTVKPFHSTFAGAPLTLAPQFLVLTGFTLANHRPLRDPATGQAFA